MPGIDIIYEMLKQQNPGSFSGVRNLLHARFEKKKNTSLSEAFSKNVPHVLNFIITIIVHFTQHVQTTREALIKKL